MSLSTPILNWPRWLNPLAWVRSLDRFVMVDDKSAPCDLSAACARRGIVVDGAHGALADASATAQLLIAIAHDLPVCTVSELLRRQLHLGTAHQRRRGRRGTT